MTRWLWIALSIGCSGQDEDAEDGPAETDGTSAFDAGGARCQPVDVTAPVIPVLSPVNIELEGNHVQYGMPDATPTAVVVYFHGTGGTASDVGKIEQQALINQLAAFGWGYLAAESADQGPGHQWDSSHDADNPDMARVVRAIEHVAELTSLEADTPIVAVGFSDGGPAISAFVDIYGDDLPIVATSFHNTRGADIEGVPGIWIAGENDGTVTPAEAAIAYEALLASGEPAEFLIHEERVLAPEMFLRNAELDADEAAVQFADMVAQGLIAEDGTRLIEGDGVLLDKVVDGWVARSPAAGAARAGEVLRVVWALHRFSGFEAEAECTFLTGIVNQP